MKHSVLLTFALTAAFLGTSFEARAYDCVCKPGDKPWGCPLMANNFYDIQHNQSCANKYVPAETCGQPSAACTNPLFGSGKQITKDFSVDYNFKVDYPAECTAFAIHSGGIDKGVKGIVDGLLYCPGIWGNYEFSAPNMDYHVTETQFNEPCYERIRQVAKTRIHIHSNVKAGPNTICVGTKAKNTAPHFVADLQAALKSRGIYNVIVDYKGSNQCAAAPGTTGRDELGLEIHKDLAVQMGSEAGQCRDKSGRFGAFVEALCRSFSSCCNKTSHGGQATFSMPGCGVGY